MDSQSVKNTDSAEQKGYDAGKKVSGIKRHIAVDTQGLPHAIHVTTANVTDRAGALAMFDQRRDGLSLVQNVLVDGGYTGDPFAAGVQSLLGASVEVVKRNEMHTFVVLPKRWVVERSFAWLEKCRRLWKNCERKLNTSLQMVVLAFAALILKRLQTGSERNPHLLRCAGLRAEWPAIFVVSPAGDRAVGLHPAGVAPSGADGGESISGGCSLSFVVVSPAGDRAIGLQSTGMFPSSTDRR